MLLSLDRFTDCRVTVIGDLMLDCYLQGDVSRISPEAPVLVVRALSETVSPGGAANVAANLAVLGVRVRVVGATGQDEARDRLLGRLREHGGLDVAGIVSVPGRPTTKKLRVLGAHQQIVRIDDETTTPFEGSAEDRILDAASCAIAPADAVIVSDYGKGLLSDRVLREVFRMAAGKPILADPKRLDFSVYSGATILTPNRKELSAATGLPCETDAEALAAARHAQVMCGTDILLTRSEKGMSYFPRDGAPIHVPTVARDVFDVSGAGDTVIATLAAAIAAGLPIRDAMKVANHAAGIVVAKVGTAVVTREELYGSLAAERASASVGDGRLVGLADAVALRWAWAREKLTVGVANGCFDLLHPGHVSLIRQAAASCDRLILALNSDASVRRLKGPGRPVQDEAARAAVIGALKGVSAVVLFDTDTPLALLEALQPDVLVKGADYTVDQVVGAESVVARGGKVVLADLMPGHSTTRLIGVAEQPVLRRAEG
jgi:D-beta-D-heptose 7-phosphate kinase/D-beta-D-heptose 1-phosphate adenosyltransferase